MYESDGSAGCDFDREEVSRWLARRYSDEKLAARILALSGLRFSAPVEAELANLLSALGSVVLARELVRNARSLDEFPDFRREAEADAAGAAAIGSRGPSRSLLLQLTGC